MCCQIIKYFKLDKAPVIFYDLVELPAHKLDEKFHTEPTSLKHDCFYIIALLINNLYIRFIIIIQCLFQTQKVY